MRNERHSSPNAITLAPAATTLVGVTRLESRPRDIRTQFDEVKVRAPYGRFGQLRLQLGYRRWKEFDAENHAGQDFCVLYSDGRRAAGVLADGVSQSFYGNLAAEYLATRLIGYLWKHAPPQPAESEIRAYLEEIRPGLHQIVSAFQIPAHLDPAVRAALEQTRDRDGSQAVFAAFVLDAATSTAWTCLLGDASIVLRTSTDVAILQSKDPRARWTSGARTSDSLLIERHAGVTGLVLRSDGALDWGADMSAERMHESAFRALADRASQRDDVSFAAMLSDQPRVVVPAPVAGETTPMFRTTPVTTKLSPRRELLDGAKATKRDVGPGLARPPLQTVVDDDREWRDTRFLASGALSGASLLYLILLLAGWLAPQMPGAALSVRLRNAIAGTLDTTATIAKGQSTKEPVRATDTPKVHLPIEASKPGSADPKDTVNPRIPATVTSNPRADSLRREREKADARKRDSIRAEAKQQRQKAAAARRGQGTRVSPSSSGTTTKGKAPQTTPPREQNAKPDTLPRSEPKDTSTAKKPSGAGT
jgi:hypothetical protein